MQQRGDRAFRIAIEFGEHGAHCRVIVVRRGREPIELRSPSSAIFWAKNAAMRSAGSIAFSRTGDPSLGEFEESIILAREGVTPDDLAAYVGSGA